MKIIRALFLAFWAIIVCSCDKDDEISKSDFSVLGVSSVTINKVTYSVNENLYWATDGATPFYIRGTQMTASTKHCIIDYQVLSSDEAKEVSATSCYSDVLVAVSSDTTTEGIIYKVIDITRPSYKEHVTYNIYFADIVD